MNQPVFINAWAKGSQKNANLGNGVFLGVETYSNEGLAQLTKDSFKQSGGVVTDLPKYVTIASAVGSPTMFSQGETGKMYRSLDNGVTWTDISNPNGYSTGVGRGTIFYQGYLFAFRGTQIEYAVTPYGTANWAVAAWQTGLQFALTEDTATPFRFPNDGAIYFGNANKVGKIFFGTAALFDPTGSGISTIAYSNLTGGTFTVGDKLADPSSGATGTVITDNGSNSMTASVNGNFAVGSTFNNGHGVSAVVTSATATTFFYSDNWLTLPELYKVSCMSFLPNNFIELGTTSVLDPLVADIIPWNPTLSTYETPLRLFSEATLGENGVKQLINRNNILYAVTGGSGSIFETNGTSFKLVADLSLYSNIRKTTGAQAQVPVFLNPLVSAIDIFGSKLLVGVSNSTEAISIYPTGYGLYPCGVWSVAFKDDGNAIQCEYVISTNTTVAVNKLFKIGFVKCMDSNHTLIGWQDNNTFGIDLVSTTDFQNSSADVALESEMMEIGTPLTPETIQNIQMNTPRQLLTGQSVTFNYRTGFDQDYTFMETFTSANNNDNGYKISSNDIGATRFLQLKIQMASTSDTNFSPVIRNIIVSP